MQLGLNIGYWSRRQDLVDVLALTREAEQLGFGVCWVAEAYGSDAATTLAWLASQTSRIGLGSGVFQIPARSPAMTAMTAASLDALSGGRFRLGLGVSGPQVSEGWHGVRFAKPLARTREYVGVVRTALAGKPVTANGEHYPLPLPGGAGKALRLAFHPVRTQVPIYLAAIGPANLRLTGEIADGWLAIFFSPDHATGWLAEIAGGQASSPTRQPPTSQPPMPAESSERDSAPDHPAGFDVNASVPLVVGDDLDACADPVRHYFALYIGGMGSRDQNFYNQLARRMGFDQAADEIQAHYLEKEHRKAAAAVPPDLIDQTSLLGTTDRIADRLRAFAEAGVTTLSVTPFAGALDDRVAALRTVCEALDRAGVGD
jgi:F420-dependent oxidoreductase-like protein